MIDWLNEIWYENKTVILLMVVPPIMTFIATVFYGLMHGGPDAITDDKVKFMYLLSMAIFLAMHIDTLRTKGE